MNDSYYYPPVISRWIARSVGAFSSPFILMNGNGYLSLIIMRQGSYIE